jgi:GTP-binding protein LepA
MQNIRNFSIIAHIDHGKSTLADRMLEMTGTIEKRKMREQVLDQMDLERERGITIKMQPVRMKYAHGGEEYILNLIDTPGHIDFSYEVSRAIKAVEGAVLLVDATQGVQAQTLTVLEMAKNSGLRIIPVVNKVDLPFAQVHETKDQIAQLLGVSHGDILEVSGKTGQGVHELLAAVIEKVPAPTPEFPGTRSSRSLIFDYEYSTHRGVVVFGRVLDGAIRTGDTLRFCALGETFTVLELGTFSPEKVVADSLSAGEIGYIVTGIKRAVQASVGDTLTHMRDPLPGVAGYQEVQPLVWASIYPEGQDDFVLLRQALERLKLSDSSLSFEEEASGTLGRGFRVGFLGMLHLEIVSERLKREHNLALVITTPTITYEVEKTPQAGGEREVIYNPAFFPEQNEIAKIFEPYARATIIVPVQYVGDLMTMFHEHEAVVTSIELFGDNRNEIILEMPLRELMRNFFDRLKSVTSGYASLSYNLIGLREANVVRLDVLVGDERVAAFSRIVPTYRVDHEAQEIVERLRNLLPRQMFDFKIQGKAMGRILASRSMSGIKKELGNFGKNGGDVTRKMKLLEKQKRGKKKMKEHGRVNIPNDVFLKVMKSDS